MQYVVFFQAEDGIRDLVRSRGLGDVYKRQEITGLFAIYDTMQFIKCDVATICIGQCASAAAVLLAAGTKGCLLYTSDAADERSSVDLGGRRIIKKKKK